MAGLDPTIADPVWWTGPEPLADTVDAALNQRQHRERWKYTSVQKIHALCSSEASPAGTTYARLPLSEWPSWDASQVAAPETLWLFQAAKDIATLAAADGDTVDLSELNEPLLIRVQAGAQVELTQVLALRSHVWIEVGEGAQVTYSRNQLLEGTQWHFLRVRLAREANIILHNHAVGGELVRQDIQIECAEEGAQATIQASACLPAGHILDQQLTVSHLAPNTTSTQVIHNLVGSKAKAILNGRIYIEKGCDDTDAELNNKNIALADDAVINTKPELEIYANEVRCAHGATIGMLDEAALFYCKSRGIDPEAARLLLCRAFLAQATQGVLSTNAMQAYEAAL